MDVKYIFVCVLYLFQTFITCYGYKRVCYYTNWSQYRKGIAKFLPEDIDVNLCTHLIYAFAKLDGNRLAPVEWNDETKPWRKGMYERFNNLKMKNPSLKTLLAVGGWNFGSKPFSDMTALPESRSEFVNSTIKYLRKRNFDGLDIDWEYPASRGGPPQDKKNLASLIKELRTAFDDESILSGNPRLLLTIAVPADEEKINNGYDVPTIAKNTDFINVMSYDLHGAWDPLTGHNSPLYAASTETGYAAQKNVKWVADYWVKLGAPSNKLIIGLPLFGRGFTLRDINDHGVGAAVSGGSDAGPHTKEMGYMSYYEVCKVIADGGKVYRDTEQMVPYIVYGDQWIGYDDIDSFTVKANWVMQNNFGGAMVWSLALDDFTGTACGFDIKYPMTSTLKRLFSQTITTEITNVISSNKQDQSTIVSEVTDIANQQSSSKHTETSVTSDVTHGSGVMSENLSHDSTQSVSVSNIGGASQISTDESLQMSGVSGQNTGNKMLKITTTVEKTVTTKYGTHDGSTNTATTLTDISNKEISGGTISGAVSTMSESISTGSDSTATVSDSVSKGSESVSSVSETISSTSDSVSTAGDAVSTTGDSVSTISDSVLTASDSVSTGSDSTATVSDAVSTVSDSMSSISKIMSSTLGSTLNAGGTESSASVSTGSDSVLIGLDSTATAPESVSESVSSVSQTVSTASDSTSTAGDSVSTSGDSVWTTSDTVSTATDSTGTVSNSVSGQKSGGIIFEKTTVEKTVTTNSGSQGGSINSATMLTSNDETGQGTVSGTFSTATDSVSKTSDSVSTVSDSLSTASEADTNLASVSNAIESVSSASDSVSKISDTVSTVSDSATTASESVLTGVDTVSTASDSVSKISDSVSTASESISTATDLGPTTSGTEATGIFTSADESVSAQKSGKVIIEKTTVEKTVTMNTGFQGGSTNSDTTLTNINNIETSGGSASSSVSTTSDSVSAVSDSVLTVPDSVATASKTVSSVSDSVSSAVDTVSTAVDSVSTAIESTSTSSGSVSTASDYVSTAPESVPTALDSVITASDSVLTELESGQKTSDFVTTISDTSSTALDSFSTEKIANRDEIRNIAGQNSGNTVVEKTTIEKTVTVNAGSQGLSTDSATTLTHIDKKETDNGGTVFVFTAPESTSTASESLSTSTDSVSTAHDSVSSAVETVSTVSDSIATAPGTVSMESEYVSTASKSQPTAPDTVSTKSEYVSSSTTSESVSTASESVPIAPESVSSASESVSTVSNSVSAASDSISTASDPLSVVPDSVSTASGAVSTGTFATAGGSVSVSGRKPGNIIIEKTTVEKTVTINAGSKGGSTNTATILTSNDGTGSKSVSGSVSTTSDSVSAISDSVSNVPTSVSTASESSSTVSDSVSSAIDTVSTAVESVSTALQSTKTSDSVSTVSDSLSTAPESVSTALNSVITASDSVFTELESTPIESDTVSTASDTVSITSDTSSTEKLANREESGYNTGQNSGNIIVEKTTIEKTVTMNAGSQGRSTDSATTLTNIDKKETDDGGTVFVFTAPESTSTALETVSTATESLSTSSKSVPMKQDPVSTVSKSSSSAFESVSTASEPVQIAPDFVSTASESLATVSESVSTVPDSVSSVSESVSSASESVSTASEYVPIRSESISTESKSVSTASESVSTASDSISTGTSTGRDESINISGQNMGNVIIEKTTIEKTVTMNTGSRGRPTNSATLVTNINNQETSGGSVSTTSDSQLTALDTVSKTSESTGLESVSTTLDSVSTATSSDLISTSDTVSTASDSVSTASDTVSTVSGSASIPSDSVSITTGTDSSDILTSKGDSLEISGQKSGNVIITKTTVEKTSTLNGGTPVGSTNTATEMTNISNKETSGSTVLESVSIPSETVSTSSGSVSTVVDSVSTAPVSVSSGSNSVSTASKSTSVTADSERTVQDSFVSSVSGSVLTPSVSESTSADYVSTVVDSVSTEPESVSTSVDSVSTTSDSGSSTSGSVITESDSVSTASESVSTASESVSTLPDSASTAYDTVSTENMVIGDTTTLSPKNIVTIITTVERIVTTDSPTTTFTNGTISGTASDSVSLASNSGSIPGKKAGNTTITIITTVEKIVTPIGFNHSASTLSETSSSTVLSPPSDSISHISDTVSTDTDSVYTSKLANQDERIKTETITSNIDTVKPLVDSAVIATDASNSQTTQTKTTVHTEKTSTSETHTANKPLEAVVIKETVEHKPVITNSKVSTVTVETKPIVSETRSRKEITETVTKTNTDGQQFGQDIKSDISTQHVSIKTETESSGTKFDQSSGVEINRYETTSFSVPAIQSIDFISGETSTQFVDNGQLRTTTVSSNTNDRQIENKVTKDETSVSTVSSSQTVLEKSQGDKLSSQSKITTNKIVETGTSTDRADIDVITNKQDNVGVSGTTVTKTTKTVQTSSSGKQNNVVDSIPKGSVTVRKYVSSESGSKSMVDTLIPPEMTSKHTKTVKTVVKTTKPSRKWKTIKNVIKVTKPAKQSKTVKTVIKTTQPARKTAVKKIVKTTTKTSSSSVKPIINSQKKAIVTTTKESKPMPRNVKITTITQKTKPTVVTHRTKTTTIMNTKKNVSPGPLKTITSTTNIKPAISKQVKTTTLQREVKQKRPTVVTSEVKKTVTTKTNKTPIINIQQVKTTSTQGKIKQEVQPKILKTITTKTSNTPVLKKLEVKTTSSKAAIKQEVQPKILQKEARTVTSTTKTESSATDKQLKTTTLQSEPKQQQKPKYLTIVKTVTRKTVKKPSVRKQLKMSTIQQNQSGGFTSGGGTIMSTVQQNQAGELTGGGGALMTVQRNQAGGLAGSGGFVATASQRGATANNQQMITGKIQGQSNQQSMSGSLANRAMATSNVQQGDATLQVDTNQKKKPVVETIVRKVTTTTRKIPRVNRQRMRMNSLQGGTNRLGQTGLLTGRGSTFNTNANMQTTGNQQQFRTRVSQRQISPQVSSMRSTLIRGQNPQIGARTGIVGMQTGQMSGRRVMNALPTTRFMTSRVGSVSSTGNMQRRKRSVSNSDYETHFRKRSLLQATNTGNTGRRSGFNSVLQSLLSIVSDFASTNNRGRNSDRSAGTSNRRQVERRRRPQPTAVPTIETPNVQERLRRLRTRGRTQQTRSSTRTAEQTNTRVQANRLSTQARARAANRILNRGLGITPTEVSSSLIEQNAILPASQVQLNRSLRNRIRGTASTQRQIGQRRQRPRTVVQTNETPVSQVQRETSQRGNVQTNELPSIRQSRLRTRIRSNTRNSVQNGQNTEQLRDSFINQMNDLRANAQIEEKNTNRLRTSLRQGQTGNSQNIGSRRNLRRPVIERNRITEDRIGVLNQQTNTIIRPNEEARRRLPQLIELGITDVATEGQGTNVSKILPTKPSFQGQQANTVLSEQQTNTAISEQQQINNRPNRQQSNRRLPVKGRSRGQSDQQVNRNVIETNLAVQPNVAAQRIQQNNILNRGRINPGNNILSNNMNSIQNVEQPSNIITRTNSIVPKAKIVPETMDNTISGNNKLLPTTGRGQVNGQINSSPFNGQFTLFPRNNLQLNSLDTMPTVLNLPQQNTILRAQQKQSQTSADATNGLRFDDLKLSADSLGQNTNSLLSQLQSFRTQTKNIEPTIQNEKPPVPITSPTLPILTSIQESSKSNLVAVKPPKTEKSTAQSPKDNISSLLKTRFPQLVPSQISALTNEIQRQVQEVVKTKLTEKFLKSQNEQPPTKQSPTPIVPSILKAISGQIPVDQSKKQVKQTMSTTNILEKKINTPKIDTITKGPTKFNSLPTKIQGVQMLSKQVDKNKANTIDLEQLRRELSRSGLPGNLVIQINPVPLLTRRGNQAMTRNGRVGIVPTAQIQTGRSPTDPLVNRISSNTNNILLSKNLRRRKRPRVPLPPVTTMSPFPQKLNAIQSPHELIRSEKGNAAEELSVLPSTPATSPRQQLRPSNQTAILSSQLKQDVSLPKSEVLWKWQL